MASDIDSYFRTFRQENCLDLKYTAQISIVHDNIFTWFYKSNKSGRIWHWPLTLRAILLASATETFGAGDILFRVCLSASESVFPQNLVNARSQKPMLFQQNQWREFRPILVTDVLGFTDVLIRFWGQKVNVTAGDDAENYLAYVLTKFSGQHIKVTAGGDITVDGSSSSYI